MQALQGSFSLRSCGRRRPIRSWMLFTQAFDESDTEQVALDLCETPRTSSRRHRTSRQIEFEYRTCEANAGEPCVISDHWGHVMRTVVINSRGEREANFATGGPSGSPRQ